MKIGIVTVYNSYNGGSFQQAVRLAEELSVYGEVCFVDFKARKMLRACLRKIWKTWKQTIDSDKPIINTVCCPFFELGEFRRMKKSWEELKVIPLEQAEDECDLLVLGSDEIWNVSREACRDPIFWGGDLKLPKIAYAPSVNNTTEEELADEQYANYLKNIRAISVRDEYSKVLLAKKTDKNISVVLDPTLLVPPQESGMEYKQDVPYVALYVFGVMKDMEAVPIIAMTLVNEMRLVSCGQFSCISDKNIHSYNGNPFHAFKNAECIVTNTYHGTAYSINYNKKFVVLDRQNNKVMDLLKRFGLEHRVMKEVNDYDRLLKEEIDYEPVNKLLDAYRAESREFMRAAMTDINVAADI